MFFILTPQEKDIQINQKASQSAHLVGTATMHLLIFTLVKQRGRI